MLLDFPTEEIEEIPNVHLEVTEEDTEDTEEPISHLDISKKGKGEQYLNSSELRDEIDGIDAPLKVG
jgi:hypothetical protein